MKRIELVEDRLTGTLEEMEVEEEISETVVGIVDPWDRVFGSVRRKHARVLPSDSGYDETGMRSSGGEDGDNE